MKNTCGDDGDSADSIESDIGLIPTSLSKITFDYCNLFKNFLAIKDDSYSSIPQPLDNTIITSTEVENGREHVHHYNRATWFSCYVNLTSTIVGAGILGAF